MVIELDFSENIFRMFISYKWVQTNNSTCYLNRARSPLKKHFKFCAPFQIRFCEMAFGLAKIAFGIKELDHKLEFYL